MYVFALFVLLRYSSVLWVFMYCNIYLWFIILFCTKYLLIDIHYHATKICAGPDEVEKCSNTIKDFIFYWLDFLIWFCGWNVVVAHVEELCFIWQKDMFFMGNFLVVSIHITLVFGNHIKGLYGATHAFPFCLKKNIIFRRTQVTNSTSYSSCQQNGFQSQHFCAFHLCFHIDSQVVSVGWFFLIWRKMLVSW